MTQREFLTHLAGDFDELIRRYNRGNPRCLPAPRQVAEKDHLLEEYVIPLLLGRAYELADRNGVQAGESIGRVKLEAGKGGWLEDYKQLAASLNQRLLNKERHDG